MTSLYIHIPFCANKCFYCSFVVSIGQKHRVDEYLECLAKEAQQYQKQKIDTIYVGGGTPSFLDNGQLEKLGRIIDENFNYEKGTIEFTFESNPESIDLAKAKYLRKLGVNRASLGVQSFNDKYLKYLGRNHNAQKAKEAYGVLRQAGFDNISVDLMYSFPGQTLQELEKDVRAMIDLGSEHLSLYTLTIEENSRFFIKNVRLEEDDILAEQYILVTEMLDKAGFGQYEVSNFAKPGKESLHNINYWQGGNYLGLGIGAHSHKDGRRWWNVSKLMNYLESVGQGQSPLEGEEVLDSEKRFTEALLFGLRMNSGVDVKALEERFKFQLTSEKENIIKQFADQGFLSWHGQDLKVTPNGRLVLDEISVELV